MNSFAFTMNLLPVPTHPKMPIPHLFRCPISLELFTDPVTLCTGQTYDRPCIHKWISSGNPTCPVTMLHLHDLSMVPNRTLSHLIRQWLDQTGQSPALLGADREHDEYLAALKHTLESREPVWEDKLRALKQVKALSLELPGGQNESLIQFGFFPLLLELVFVAPQSLELAELALSTALKLMPFSDLGCLNMLKEEAKMASFSALLEDGTPLIKISLCRLLEAVLSQSCSCQQLRELSSMIRNSGEIQRAITNLILDDDSDNEDEEDNAEVSEAGVKAMQALCSNCGDHNQSQKALEKLVQLGGVSSLARYIARALARNVVFDIFTGKGQDMVFTVYGEHWRKMRRIMTVPFFTNKVVQQYRHGWESEAAAVVEDVKSNPEAATKGIVLRRRLQMLMYNNMYRIMFDRRFEKEDDPLFNKLKALNGERSRLAQSFDYNYGDFIPILRPFLRGYLNICKEVKERRLKLFKDYFVDEHKKLGSSKPSNNNELKCAIDHILEAQQKGEINEDNVLYIVENINVAAIETTLWSIEWGIAELVNHPEIQRKLRDELDSVLGKGVQVTEPDLPKLPYLQAVVKETLRLRMAIPLLVPHMNLHDAKLGGFDIPAESKILVNAWWLANNPAHWKKPEEFRPERFLEEEAKVDANGNDFRYLPFGVGRRSCPGIILALPILGITIGRMVQNFELSPPPGEAKLDTTEKGGQFSLHILKHSTIVMKPRSF